MMMITYGHKKICTIYHWFVMGYFNSLAKHMLYWWMNFLLSFVYLTRKNVIQWKRLNEFVNMVTKETFEKKTSERGRKERKRKKICQFFNCNDDHSVIHKHWLLRQWFGKIFTEPRNIQKDNFFDFLLRWNNDKFNNMCVCVPVCCRVYIFLWSRMNMKMAK